MTQNYVERRHQETAWKRAGTSKENAWRVIGRTVCLSHVGRALTPAD